MNLLLYFALWNILQIPLGFVNIHTKTSSHTTMTRKIFLEKKADTTLVNHKQIPLNKKLAKKRKHSKLKAILLAFPLTGILIGGGFLGLHRFYLGYKKTGWAMFTLGLPTIVFAIMALLLFPNSVGGILGSPFYFTFIFPIIYLIAIWVIIDFALISMDILKFKDGTPLEW